VKIVQANKFHFVKGGAERYYLDLSRRLEQRGHEVIPFAMADPRNEPSSHAEYFVGAVDYRTRMGTARKMRQAARAIYSRETVHKASLLARRERPAIAHLHNIYHQISPSLILAFHRCGVPMVQTLHDYKVVCPGYLFMSRGQICEACFQRNHGQMIARRCLLDSYPASIAGWMEWRLHSWLQTYARIARFLAPSRFLLEKVAEHGIPREKLVHFPYFLPLEDYRPAYARSSYFVYLGRLSREKGIATLLAALGMRQGSLVCRILGEGPLEPALRRQAEEAGLRQVEFRGYLQGEELQTAIRDAAFTVVPSEWYENLPFSVIESFALGTPVVGARIGGIPEMVIEGETGRTFAPGDAAALAAALDWMESHPEEMLAMGSKARQFAEREYSPGPHLDRLEKLYAEVAREARDAKEKR